MFCFNFKELISVQLNRNNKISMQDKKVSVNPFFVYVLNNPPYDDWHNYLVLLPCAALCPG